MHIGSSLSTLKIQNNIAKLNTIATKGNEKLASGIRINRAADDAAGLNISEKMRAQIRGLDMSIDNATDGISMLQTAEGGLAKITDLFHRMNELSVKAVNGINTAEDLNKISIEYEQCKCEIDRIAETTTFNGKQLLNINVGETKTATTLTMVGTNSFSARSHEKIDFSTIGDGNEFYIKKGNEEYRFKFTYKDSGGSNGAIKVRLNGDESNEEKAYKLVQAIDSNISDVRVEAIGTWPDDKKSYTISVISRTPNEGEKIELGVKTYAPIIKVGNKEDDIIFLNFNSVTSKDLGVRDTSVLSVKEADNASRKINDAITMVSTIRGKLGATQNRLEYTINRITIESENTNIAESRIRNVDMAEQMVSSVKTRILQQSAISMLAQANQSGDMVLKLLKN